MGSAVKFIPRPVVLGFTNGIALLIASTQIKDFFGLQVDKVPGEFLARLEVLGAHFNTISPSATALSCAALLIIVLAVRYVPRIPGYIIALVVGTLVVAAFGLNVETIGSRFGGIPSGLPKFAIPRFRLDLLQAVLSRRSPWRCSGRSNR